MCIKWKTLTVSAYFLRSGVYIILLYVAISSVRVTQHVMLHCLRECVLVCALSTVFLSRWLQCHHLPCDLCSLKDLPTLQQYSIVYKRNRGSSRRVHCRDVSSVTWTCSETQGFTVSLVTSHSPFYPGSGLRLITPRRLWQRQPGTLVALKWKKKD